MTKRKDYTGQKYHQLVIMGDAYDQTIGGQTKRFVNVACDCGKRVIKRLDFVVSGKTKSCGCRNTKSDLLERFKKADVGHKELLCFNDYMNASMNLPKYGLWIKSRKVDEDLYEVQTYIKR